MRKLNILKAIVDYVWIMSVLIFPVLVVFSIYSIISVDMIDIPIKISGNTINLNNNWSKAALIVNMINFGVLLLALYNFKKLLVNFKNKRIFVESTSLLLNKTGSIILFSSFICFIAEFLSNISKSNFVVQFGFGPFLYLIALGLFFIVLAEVFTMARKIKEENEFTV